MANLYSEPVIPVVMSICKRVGLLERTLHQLSKQEGVRPLPFFLNNNPAIARDVEEEVRKHGRKLRIRLTHSDNRLACFGRFVLARQIKNGYPFLVFIDDDQQFDRTFLRNLWDERTANGVTGCHAFAFEKGGTYWHRHELEAGERAHYCGPGGMILDSRLLDRPELFHVPKQGLLIDDIWFSHFLNKVVQAPMHKSSARVRMIDQKNDTWHTIHRDKVEFLEHLREQGWNV
jgi:hypothetical protein